MELCLKGLLSLSPSCSACLLGEGPDQLDGGVLLEVIGMVDKEGLDPGGWWIV